MRPKQRAQPGQARNEVSRDYVPHRCLNGIRKEPDITEGDRDVRFELPLYTVAEAARIVDVPPSTLATWAKGYVRRPPDRSEVEGEAVITYIQPERPGAPVIPFVGLAESLVLAAIRRSGVPMQRVRPALEALSQGLGLDHALASKKLYTDGAELLYDFGEHHRDTIDGQVALELVVVRSGQRVFGNLIEEYLRRIEYDASDGYARLIHVPAYRKAEVVVDPMRSFGAPIFERGAGRVEDVMQRFWAGESLDELADDYGVPPEQLEDVVRVASRRAA